MYQCSAFWRAKLNPDVHFRRPLPENLDNSEKQIFPGYRKYQIQWQGFLEASSEGTLSALWALHFVPRCLQSVLSRRPKLRFGPEILFNSTLFAVGGNNTLELISNWTVIFFFNSGTLYNPKKSWLFWINYGFWSPPTKMDIGFEIWTSKYITMIKKVYIKPLFWTCSSFSLLW